MRYRQMLYCGFIASAVVACDAEDPSAPLDITPQHTMLAEIPPDPNPGADGVWIGLSLDDCYTTLTDDLDEDSLRDTCENRLAEFLAPELIMSSSDSHRGHEPYYAAKWASDGNSVDLFWAFGYYIDGGTPGGFGCSYSQGYCNGHYGDSEWVLMNVEYDNFSKHWELNNVRLSQHNGSQLVSGSFVSSDLRYPTIHVAWGKHANYKSDADCDAGGFGGYDECYGGVVMRSPFNSYHNLGSSAVHLKNCVYSEGTYAGNQEQECFWATTGQFRGWTGVTNVPPFDSASDVPAYGTKLLPNGF